MKINTEGTVVSALSKPYSFEGREGISHKIRVNVGGEIWNCASNANQVLKAQQFVGKDVELTLIFTSPKENVKVEVDFE